MTATNNFALYFAVFFSVLMPAFVIIAMAEGRMLLSGFGAVAFVAGVAWVVYMVRLLKR